MTFQPSGLGLSIFQERYARTQEETWEEACRRVARAIAAAEENGKAAIYEERFANLLTDNTFMPGGRVWYGAGRPKQQLLNCFVVPIGDSREAWGKSISDMLVISGMGGGVGANFSPVRGRGYKVKGTGGIATGAVSLMEMWDGVGGILVSGGGRRMALMLDLDFDHPDIEEFLDKKLNKRELNNANISVVIPERISTERFQEMVRNDEQIFLQFKGVDDEFGRTISAKWLWERIVENAWNNGEPGVLNAYEANRANNVWYHHALISTNPCVTADTIIAIADGRNGITIGDLAREGKDVPVYCSDPVTGQTVIRMGRNPRKTGVQREVWKVTLDDGSVVRATPNHKFLLRSGEYVELQNLKPDDSLRPFNSYESNGYRQIADAGAEVGRGGKRRSRRQYRLIYEERYGEVPEGFEVHHSGFNQKDDRIGNLIAMPAAEHRELHASKMRGLNNPYHQMTSEWKRSFVSHPGASNGRALAVSNEELLEHGRKCWAQNNGSISQSKWIAYAKERGLPQFVANKCRFGTWSDFKLAVSGNHRVVSIEFDGYEDVFNITVDEHHNYHVITSSDDEVIRSSGVCVKNCGEIFLPAYGCCCLGALVLPRFVEDGEFDWDRLDESIRLSTRFLDNVLDVNHYPLPEIARVSQEERRIGLGVMGLHTMLLDMGLSYGSSEGREFIDQLFNTLKNTAYDASINLAIEKGPFSAYDRRLLESGFAKTLKRGIRNKIKEHGLRNCALLTIAPTGTTSMVCGVTGGIEPLFAPVYARRRKVVDGMANESIIETLVVSKEYQKHGALAIGSYDVSPESHFEMQEIVQTHIDNAVSKTINLPRDYPVEKLAELWLKFLPTMKGSTFYREGSREDPENGVYEPMRAIRLDEVAEVMTSWEGEFDMEAPQDEQNAFECATGTCEVPQLLV